MRFYTNYRQKEERKALFEDFADKEVWDVEIYDMVEDDGYDELCGWTTLKKAIDLFNKTEATNREKIIQICFASYGEGSSTEERNEKLQKHKETPDEYDLDVLIEKSIKDKGKKLVWNKDAGDIEIL